MPATTAQERDAFLGSHTLSDALAWLGITYRLPIGRWTVLWHAISPEATIAMISMKRGRWKGLTAKVSMLIALTPTKPTKCYNNLSIRPTKCLIRFLCNRFLKIKIFWGCMWESYLELMCLRCTSPLTRFIDEVIEVYLSRSWDLLIDQETVSAYFYLW